MSPIPITDLFSHKIHSNDDDWPDKLVELASLFSSFDGQVFDRDEIESSLRNISTRSAYAPRDPSKFRDEISAYPAYLGLYRLEQSDAGWRIRIGDTTRQFLLREEPNVGAFMRLQLALFQYPNGMGAAYQSGTNNARMQANARDRTLDFISKGIHLSPLRLICVALEADSRIRATQRFDARIGYDEIFALANSSPVNERALPRLEDVVENLRKIRGGSIVPPSRFERRFHTLRHTEIFELEDGGLKFRAPIDEEDKRDLISKIDVIESISAQFNGFDAATTGPELEAIVGSGTWGRYFDGIRTLASREAGVLGSDIIDLAPTPMATTYQTRIVPAPTSYRLKSRERLAPVPSASDRRGDLADPEITRIKRQRSNLAHKRLMDLMDELLRRKGASPLESPHIDMYAKLPDDGSFLFEMKSEGNNQLDQIRKGISQLYEYRFRYKDAIESSTVLCLVLSNEPLQFPWLEEYLCKDREISMCWFDSVGRPECPDSCKERLEALFA